MASVLLFNPSYQGTFGGNKASIINPIFPTLGLATIAAMAQQRGHRVKVVDLSWRNYDPDEIEQQVRTLQPDIVGITATTPLMNQMRDISVLVKDISKQILVVGGGPHVSALPGESLLESRLDAVCVGEADESFAEICDGRALADIPGLTFRESDGVRSTGLRRPIACLDDLPMPAWELFDVEMYRKHISRLFAAKRPPLTMAEFSRGCVYKCDFCASKITMGLGYRKKSPERCAEEVQRMHELGFGEFCLADDIFSSDKDWATQVCQAIQRKGSPMYWSCTNGIRVESADDNLFKEMWDAGCYRVAFGFESGSDAVLKAFGKGGRASLQSARVAVKLARGQGIDVNGYFQLGLSSDDESSIIETIEFARELPLDLIKFGVTIAFPGTPMFDNYHERGLIRSYNWDDYYVYSPEPLFAHPSLSYGQIMAQMKRAYRRAILTNPAFILRRLWRGIRTRQFFWDAYYFTKFALSPPCSNKPVGYYAKDRWPTVDYDHRDLRVTPTQQVQGSSLTA